MNEALDKMKTEKITVAILEDNATLVKGMVAELEQPDISICTISDNVNQFLEDIISNQPNIAIVDLRIWGSFNAGLTSIVKAKELSPDTSFIIHTAYDDIENFHQSINLGVKAFVSKNIYEKPLDEIVRIVFRGGTYYGEFLPKYLDKVKEGSPYLNFDEENLIGEKDVLTHKEQEVLFYLDKDLSQEDIAKQLVVSVNTIKAHTKNIRAKFGVKTTKEAVRIYRLRKEE